MSELIGNRKQRVHVLKDMIQRLHDGAAPEEVRNALRTLVRETDPTEIMAMEQELMAEGMPPAEIQRLCDLHSEVTRELLVPPPARALAHGHPIDTFREENKALRAVLVWMRRAVNAPELTDSPNANLILERWQKSLSDLMNVEKHYQRKEHLLFSYLERHGITGPPKVMWGKDDEIRALLKELASQGQDKSRESRLARVRSSKKAIDAVEEMIYKEENILFPLCLDTFSDEEWNEIGESSPRYGWCLVEPREGFRPSSFRVAETSRAGESGAIQLPTGHLSLDELRAIFSTLPVDITFVDAEDRVAFYSEGPDRIFARSKAVIGRQVQRCHPPRSVHLVQRILHDFRHGRRSMAEFWIQLRGRFVHIRYFAVRGGDNRYLGTLEVTQDLTELRALKGERRLLEYDTKPSEGERTR
jgi:DUF438 domain-containing protein